ncbi:MAG: hypothetical protein K0U33_02855, partial [Bacteroidetes bacterium]|nr:hypothetical protein [Bacteroidota bacterium]
IERADLQFGYIMHEDKDKQLALYFKKSSLQKPEVQNLIKLMKSKRQSNWNWILKTIVFRVSGTLNPQTNNLKFIPGIF